MNLCFNDRIPGSRKILLTRIQLNPANFENHIQAGRSALS